MFTFTHVLLQEESSYTGVIEDRSYSLDTNFSPLSLLSRLTIFLGKAVFPVHHLGIQPQ